MDCIYTNTGSSRVVNIIFPYWCDIVSHEGFLIALIKEVKVNLDRLQFRAWCEVPLKDDNGKEKVYGFYLYQINVYDGGKEIGFDENTLSDNLSIYSDLPSANFSDDTVQGELQGHFTWNNCVISDNYYRYKEFKCIEQCTGLKDKNKEYIYEGDILRYTTEDGECYTGALISDRNHILRFVNFRVNEDFDLAWSGLVDDVYLNGKGTLEVIGNNHEEKMKNKWEEQEDEVRQI